MDPTQDNQLFSLGGQSGKAIDLVIPDYAVNCSFFVWILEGKKQSATVARGTGYFPRHPDLSQLVILFQQSLDIGGQPGNGQRRIWNQELMKIGCHTE